MRPAAVRLALMAAVAAALVVAACGQKGPLYLPEKGGQVVTTSATAPAPGQSAPRQPSPTPQAQSAPGQTMVTPAQPAQTQPPTAQPPTAQPPTNQPQSAQPAPATPSPHKKADPDSDSQTPQ
jgi:predicted small lipoprotein YifL